MSVVARQEANVSSRILPIFTTIILFLSSGYVSLRITEDPTRMSYLYLLMVIQVAPFIFALSTGRQNFLSIVMFNQFVSYSLAKYNQVVNINQATELYPEAFAAVKEVTFATILTTLAYYSARAILFNKLKEKRSFSPIELERNHLFWIALFLCSYPFIRKVIPISLQAIHNVSNIMALILLLCSTCPDYKQLMLLARWAAILSSIYDFMISGSLGMPGAVAGVLFITAILHRKLSSLTLLLFISVGLVITQPIKNEYRQYIRQNYDTPFSEKASVIFDLVSVSLTEGDAFEEYLEDRDEENQSFSSFDTFFIGFARIGNDSVERVMAWTPSRVPFWDGESYKNIPFMFIPRIIWPDKPDWKFWNKFGRLYGYLSPNDFRTSVGVSYLAEGYMNFGFMGMYVIAFLFGIIIAGVERLSISMMGGDYYFFTICFLIPLLVYANDFGVILNGIILMSTHCYIFKFFLFRKITKDIYT